MSKYFFNHTIIFRRLLQFEITRKWNDIGSDARQDRLDYSASYALAQSLVLSVASRKVQLTRGMGV